MFSFLTTFHLTHRPYSNQLNELLAPYGLLSNQWGLIRYLAENGPATFSDMVAFWQVERPSVTPIAQKLVERQLISISPGEDKRQKFMHITEQGIEMYEQVKRDMIVLQKELLEGVTEEEKQIAERVLEKLRVNLLKRGS